jgi:hypothetical protein
MMTTFVYQVNAACDVIMCLSLKHGLYATSLHQFECNDGHCRLLTRFLKGHCEIANDTLEHRGRSSRHHLGNLFLKTRT